MRRRGRLSASRRRSFAARHRRAGARADVGYAFRHELGVVAQRHGRGAARIAGVGFLRRPAQALGAALGAFGEPKVVLIAGGSDKGDVFDQLAPLFKQSVKYAILIGATREKVALAAKKAEVLYEFAESMDEAVRKAISQAAK